MDYKVLASEILNCVGGEKNVSDLSHCMTRLRFVLKDDAKADAGKVKKIKGVVDVIVKGGQFQVVIGPDVGKVYDEIQKTAVFTKGNVEKQDGEGIFSKVIGAITAIFQPIIPAICGAGMVKAILAILVFAKWMDTSSQTYVLLTMVADSAFYFLPIFLSFSAAKVFKCDPFLAVVMGAILLHPTFTGLVGVGEPVKFWGIPVRLANYGSAVVPPVIIVFLMSYVEKFAKKIIPNAVKVFMVPLVTFMIMAPVALCAAGPLGSYLGDLLYLLFTFLDTRAGWLIPFLMGTFAPILVMTGMHYSIVPVALAQFASVGYMTILSPGMLASNIAQATATLFVGLKTKNKELKQTALSSSATAYFGITEPSLYGVTLPLKRPLISAMIGGAAAGLWAGVSHMRTYASASAGLLAFPVYICDDMSNVRNAVICVIISFVVTAIASFILKFEDVKVENEGERQGIEDSPVQAQAYQKANRYEEIASPINGEVIPLSQVKDEVFSKQVLGKGIAVIPKEGKVYAPFDGKVKSLFETGHAIGLQNQNGVELLIHVGMDTVELKGKFFKTHVNVEDEVKEGQLLLEFEIEGIQGAGYEIVTPIIVSNTGDYLDVVEMAESGTVKNGDSVLKVVL